jgi:hypothetical protein
MQEKDIHNKLNKFSSICGTLRRTLKTKTRKATQMKFYKWHFQYCYMEVKHGPLKERI